MAIRSGIQLRNHEVGAVRLGYEDVIDGKTRAHKLDKFRFTSPSLIELRQVAHLYGGEVTEWFPRRDQTWGKQWQVFSEVNEIPIGLPPGELVISQDMTLYDGGGLRRKCDGITMSRPAVGPCQCPQPLNPSDPVSVDEAIMRRKELAAKLKPAACKPFTRFCMWLPDIGDIGVWVLRTRSEEAAAEVIAKALLLERARAAGVTLSARLAAEQRQQMAGGILRQYPVPVIRLDDSVRAIAEGTAGRTLAEQLPPPPGQERLQLTRRAAPVTAPPPGEEDMAVTAQGLADKARAAADRDGVRPLIVTAKRLEIGGNMVWAPADDEPGGSDIEMTLAAYLTRRFTFLPAAGPAAASA